MITPGTVAADAMGPGPTTERYFCRYGLNADYVEILQRHGLVFSGRDTSGEVRVAELPDHPFCVASLFQPELSSDPTWVHPLIAAFAARSGRTRLRWRELRADACGSRHQGLDLGAARRCPECGYDASAATRPAVPGLIRDNAGCLAGGARQPGRGGPAHQAARGSLVRRGVRLPRTRRVPDL